MTRRFVAALALAGILAGVGSQLSQASATVPEVSTSGGRVACVWVPAGGADLGACAALPRLGDLAP